MVWAPETGAWLTWWMKYQIFAPILLLQFLNLFWYFLIWRVLLRYVHVPFNLCIALCHPFLLPLECVLNIALCVGPQGDL